MSEANEYIHALESIESLKKQLDEQRALASDHARRIEDSRDDDLYVVPITSQKTRRDDVVRPRTWQEILARSVPVGTFHTIATPESVSFEIRSLKGIPFFHDRSESTYLVYTIRRLSFSLSARINKIYRDLLVELGRKTDITDPPEPAGCTFVNTTEMIARFLIACGTECFMKEMLEKQP